EALLPDQLLEYGQFVLDSLEDIFDAQLRGALGDGLRAAAGEQGTGHAARREHLQAVAVVRREGLQLLARRAVEQRAVGEHAVDVEDHQPHRARASQNVSRAPFSRDRLQITFARNRSCMLSAPSSAPRASTTSSWLTLCFSMICTASTASAS